MDNNMLFRTVLIVLAAFVLFALVNYYNNKQNTLKTEKFYQETTSVPERRERVMQQQNYSKPETFVSQEDVAKVNMVSPSEPEGNEMNRPVDFMGSKIPNDCFPKDRLTSDDLLPKDAANSKWAQVNPAGQGDVKDQNFLSAGYMVGINTVGSSLKNANLQLRSEPVIPKVSVGPFLNSSYEASDALRRPLEIGGDC
jgi:hypothetical protein